MLKREKVLVTGAAGFVGSNLVSRLLEEQNYEILGIDNINNYYSINLKLDRLKEFKKNKDFSFKKIDLNDSASLKNCFEQFKPRIVFNLAAQAGVRYSLENPTSYIDSNINGFFNIINLCQKYEVERLIFASSSSVYGSSKNIPFSETDSELMPISLYGSTKLSNEKMASTYSKVFGLKTIGLRFFTVYGPKGRPDMAYFSFAKDILDGKPITVFNKGKMSRDMTFVKDICEGLFECLNFEFKNNSYEIFNLGNNYPIELMDLVRFIEKKVGKKAKIIYKESSLEVKKTHADLSKASSMLNYFPETPFEEGMEKFLKWYSKYYNIE
tara:strand:- start:19273 stop:20250 length:978 start_codon:yes stop_codon:yes gene_type:complete